MEQRNPLYVLIDGHKECLECGKLDGYHNKTCTSREETMGYNSTILVMNDALGNIQRDTDFGAKIYNGITGFRSEESNYISSFGHINAAVVLSCDHADSFRGLVIGANTGWDMGTAGHWSTHFRDNLSEEERKLYFLKRMAETLGYTLRKK